MGRFRDFLMGRNEEDVVTIVSEAEPRVVTLTNPSLPVRYGSSPSPQGYGALLSVDYAACEQTKARSMASLPARVMSGGHVVDGHPLAALFNGRANEAMTSAALMDWHRLRTDTFGTSYVRVEWFKGAPVALWPVIGAVIPDFDINRPKGRKLAFDLAGDEYNPRGRYFAHEVVAVSTHLTKDALKGVSLATTAAQQVGLSIELEQFYRSLLDNGNHHLGHVEISEKNIPPAALEDLRAAIDAKAGTGEAGKAPIFAYGAHWINDRMTMKDASLVEQQEWILRQVCRACNVPTWKVYEAQGVSYAGSQQANIDYVTDTILPDVRAIELAFAPVLESMGQRGAQLKFNLRGLMRGDDASRASYYREMTYAGIYARADVRELEDMEPIAGLEKPYFPLNYGEVEQDGSVTVHGAEKTPADGNQQK